MRGRRTSIWISISAGALLVLVLAAATWLSWRVWRARTPSLHDDFTSDSADMGSSSGWQAFGGTWQVARGEMQNISDDRGAKLLNGDRHWGDYIVQSDVQLLGESGDAGFVVRTNDEQTGVDAYHGYFAGLRDLDDTLIIGRADFGWHEYRADPIRPSVKTGNWYRLRVIAYGCVIAAEVSGPRGEHTVSSVHDPNCIRQGRVGLQSYSTGAIWRNFDVRPATAQDLRAMLGDQQPPVPGAIFGEPAIVNLDAFHHSIGPFWRELQGHHSDLHATPIADLRLMAPDHSSLVTVQGVVTLVSPLLYVQDATGGIAIPNAASDRPLQIGDAVEATGAAEMHDFSSVMRDAAVRPLWTHASVPPVAVSASQAATGAFDARFIETEGILVSASNTSEHALLLRLTEGSQSFESLTQESSPGKSSQSLKPGSRLRLRGICVTSPAYTRNEIPFSLLLRSAEDIQVIDPPPWWNTRHVVGLVILLLTLSLGSQILYTSVKRARLRAVVEERERLAHEMHDTLAQSFAGLGFQLEALARDAVPGSAMRSQLESSLDLVRFCHTEARRNIAALRPGKLDQLGLARALEEAGRSMVQGGQVRFVCSVRGTEKDIPLRIADPLFRIGQEAIANGVRHAHPSRIGIHLVYGRTRIKLSVQDNGSGFAVGTHCTGMGIRGMKRRAHALGATLKILSSPGHGTTISVRASIPKTRLTSWWLRTIHQSGLRNRFHE